MDMRGCQQNFDSKQFGGKERERNDGSQVFLMIFEQGRNALLLFFSFVVVVFFFFG
jgi:hypothetical protein